MTKQGGYWAFESVTDYEISWDRISYLAITKRKTKIMATVYRVISEDSDNAFGPRYNPYTSQSRSKAMAEASRLRVLAGMDADDTDADIYVLRDTGSIDECDE